MKILARKKWKSKRIWLTSSKKKGIINIYCAFALKKAWIRNKGKGGTPDEKHNEKIARDHAEKRNSGEENNKDGYT